MPHKLTRIHVILFVLTFFTTLSAGALLNGIIPWEEPEKIYMGLPFSLTLLFILLTHELSHYFMSRKHNVSATLPYFIPAPSIIGTFGAIIKMKPPIPDRRSLIDIGASGPIGGFVIAVIASVVGLSLSEVRPSGEMQEGIYFGSSILFSFLSEIILNVNPEKFDVLLANSNEADFANVRYFSYYWPLFEIAGVAISPDTRASLTFGTWISICPGTSASTNLIGGG